MSNKTALSPPADAVERARTAAVEILSRLDDWKWFPATNAVATVASIITRHLAAHNSRPSEDEESQESHLG